MIHIDAPLGRGHLHLHRNPLTLEEAPQFGFGLRQRRGGSNASHGNEADYVGDSHYFLQT
jgi:hypothetical protein